MSAMGRKPTFAGRALPLIINPAHRTVAPIDAHAQTPAAGPDRDTAIFPSRRFRKRLEDDPASCSILLNVEHISRPLFCGLSAADDRLRKLPSNPRVRHKLSYTTVAVY